MGKTPTQGAQVQPLIEELRSHMLCCPAKKKKEREILNVIYNYLLKSV